MEINKVASEGESLDIMVKDALPHGWELLGFNLSDLSNAKYRLITQLPAYRLTKPVEVALIEKRDGNPKEKYTAVHFMPTLGKHPQFIARASTEREALDTLAQSLLSRFKGLQSYLGNLKLQGKEIQEDDKMELQYLESLITHYRTA
jgi:hypothetical protein